MVRGKTNKRRLALVLALASLATVANAQTIDLPPEWRVPNYGRGSCGHAAIAQLMHAHGEHDLADWWSRNHRGGVFTQTLVDDLTAAHVPFWLSTRCDLGFVEECIKRGRPVAVSVPYGSGWHVVTVVGWTRSSVWILDNNDTKRYYELTHGEFHTIRDYVANTRPDLMFAIALASHPLPSKVNK